MEKDQSDRPVRNHIERLVKEEHALYEQNALTAADQQRLSAIKIELDQCWDLLRQRRALREYGQNPEEARVRPKEVVEDYKQ